MRSDKHKNKKARRKRFWQTILSIAILLAIFIGGATGYYGSKVVSFLDGISTDEAGSENPENIELTRQLEDLEPFSALILGTDVVDQGSARSDTIIVATVNPETNDMKMVSIPRDTIITLPDGRPEKINAFFATGGPELAQEEIGEYLDIPIDFYATMDFRGLVELVDAVNGITVNSDLEFTEDNYMDKSNPVHIEEGLQRLNGAEALGYARMRKQDPRGDFGRQDRQQEVIMEVLDKLMSFNTITNLSEVLNAIQPYLETNATTRQMLAIAGNYASVAGDIEQVTLEGEARNEYFPHYGFEVYVWEPYEDSLDDVQDELREHLELDTGTEINEKNELETVHPSSIEGTTEEE
jgi:LCP family protein required for cell wall assembly